MKQRGLFDGPEERPGPEEDGKPGRDDGSPASAAPKRTPGPASERGSTPPDSPDSPGPPDADARRRAVTTFDRPVLLEAGAGTGKTATLVARVLQWCLGPGWDEVAEPELAPDDVAVLVLRGVSAITFTEAAAAEMSTRVGQALATVQRVAGTGSLDPDALPRGLVLEELGTADELSLRARALRAGLDHLNVSTIHAFCRRLLAAHPLDCGLDPGFEVDATFSRTVVVIRDVIEAFLDEAWSEPVDEDLIELARGGVGPQEIEKALFDLVEKGARAADFEADPFGPERVAAVRARLEPALDELARATEPLRPLTSNTTPDALEALDAARALVAERPDLDGLCAAARVWQEPGPRAWNRLKGWGKGDLLKSTERKLVDDDGAAAIATAALAVRTGIEPFLELEPVKLRLARRVVARLLGDVERELRRQGVATFGDLLIDARRLLEERPDVARRERRRLRLLCVDEFQDTDEVQCAVVRALGLSAEAGDEGEDDGPALFLVGDPKQSIFAWRNADLRAYDRFANDLRDQGGQVLALTANFRSRTAILREVDRAVAPVMEEEFGVQPAFVPLQAGRDDADEPASDGEPRVEYWLSWAPNGDGAPGPGGEKGATYELEAAAIARDVEERRRRDPSLDWGDFALVFRAQTDIEPYLLALREHGIPYEVQADRKYYRRREILDATSLVRAVLDPHDHVALVALLRTPSIGVPDAALPPLWEAGLPGLASRLRGSGDDERLARLDEAIRQARARVPDDVPGLAAVDGWERTLADGLRALSALRGSYRRDPVDRFVERLRAELCVDVTEAARYLGSYRLANLDRFFRELERMLEETDGDGRVVLRTLRNQAAREDRSEGARPGDEERAAVAVTTVHGAKGLEFAHVYVAQTHRQGRRGQEDATAFERRGAAVAYKLFGSATPAWVDAREERKRSEAAERVRLLYVALTRARERLVVLGDLEPGKPKDWSSAQTFGELLHGRAAAAARTPMTGDRDGPILDEHGVGWRLARSLVGDDAGRERAPAAAVDAPHVPVDARLLAERRRLAREREARPFHSVASREGHVDDAELRARRRYGEASALPEGAGERAIEPEARDEPLGRIAAQAVGTAVHRVLEELDLADAERDLARRIAGLEEALRPNVAADVLPRAVERARELLGGFRTNGLCARLTGLREQVVARELAVLAPPPDAPDAAVGFVSGAIDLCYRDPATGELVIADYKTDRVEGDEALAARAAAYAGQGAAYTQALTQALALERPPRFELWFLHAGEVVALDVTPS